VQLSNSVHGDGWLIRIRVWTYGTHGSRHPRRHHPCRRRRRRRRRGGNREKCGPAAHRRREGIGISVTDSEGRSGTGSTHEGPKASGEGHRLGAELYACVRTSQGPLVAGMINYVRQELQPSSDQIRKCPSGYNQHRARIALCARPHLSTRVAAAASATSTASAAAHRALPGNVPRLSARVASPRHSFLVLKIATQSIKPASCEDLAVGDFGGGGFLQEKHEI